MDLESRINNPEFASSFWGHVQPSTDEKCWPWMRSCRTGGYGSAGFFKHQFAASRLAFRIVHGRWPVMACHTCDNPICCNPHHIVDKDCLWNVRDMMAKKRNNPPRGDRCGAAKLTWEIVGQIRSLHSGGMSQTKLSKMFNCSQPTISEIVHLKTWRPMWT